MLKNVRFIIKVAYNLKTNFDKNQFQVKRLITYLIKAHESPINMEQRIIWIHRDDQKSNSNERFFAIDLSRMGTQLRLRLRRLYYLF